MKTRTRGEKSQKNRSQFFSCTFFRCLYRDLDYCFNSLWCWKWWRFFEVIGTAWTCSKPLFLGSTFGFLPLPCSKQFSLSTLLPTAPWATGKWLHFLKSRVTPLPNWWISMFSSSLLVYGTYFRVAISNELHTRKIKLIDAYSPESDDPRKYKHRTEPESSAREREREIEELRFQWCSQLLLDHGLNQ